MRMIDMIIFSLCVMTACAQGQPSDIVAEG